MEDQQPELTEHRFRIATYNVHKCRGMDQRIRPERVLKVLRELDADIIALQEVWSLEGGRSEQDQARFFAEELGLEWRLGENRRFRGGAYGNLVLTRFPVVASENHDLSQRGREERGCLRVDVRLGENTVLHVYNVHLGTAFLERPPQARRLLTEDVLRREDVRGARILLGDFNEWLKGVAWRLLARHFDSADIRLHMGRNRTYPGVLPLVHLDHIYFDSALALENALLHRSRTAVMASDHLPIVADFRLAADAEHFFIEREGTA